VPSLWCLVPACPAGLPYNGNPNRYLTGVNRKQAYGQASLPYCDLGPGVGCGWVTVACQSGPSY